MVNNELNGPLSHVSHTNHFSELMRPKSLILFILKLSISYVGNAGKSYIAPSLIFCFRFIRMNWFVLNDSVSCVALEILIHSRIGSSETVPCHIIQKSDSIQIGSFSYFTFNSVKWINFVLKNPFIKTVGYMYM